MMSDYASPATDFQARMRGVYLNVALRMAKHFGHSVRFEGVPHFRQVFMVSIIALTDFNATSKSTLYPVNKLS